jgi:hypothetical protein
MEEMVPKVHPEKFMIGNNMYQQKRRAKMLLSKEAISKDIFNIIYIYKFQI